MTVDKHEIKALALACDPAKCADEAEEGRRLAEFYSELTPEVVLGLLEEAEQLEAQARLAGVAAEVTVHQEVGRAVTRELALTQERDQLKAENEALRKDAERWRFVRNAVPNRSPFAVWYEGSLPFLGSKADEAVDAAMAKEASRG